MPAKRTEPTKNATHQNAGFKYVNSVSTDLRKTFAAARPPPPDPGPARRPPPPDPGPARRR